MNNPNPTTDSNIIFNPKKDIQGVYRNKIILFILWFFLFLNLGFAVLIIYSVSNGTGEIYIPIVIFSGIIVLNVLLIILFFKIRVVLYNDRIIIYGKRYQNESWINAFIKGYTITFDSLSGIDLVPIKFMKRVITYQICFRIKDFMNTVYLYSLSNLDDLFINIRTRRFKKRNGVK